MKVAAITRLVLAAAVLTALPARGQQRPYTPPQGSAERAAVLSALRPTVEQRLHGHVTFADIVMNVHGGWAFVRAIPFVRPGGHGDTVPELPINERLDPFVYGLLRSGGGGWSVVETAMEVPPGAAPWTAWPALHRVPAAVFARDPDDVALEAAMREYIDAMAFSRWERFVALLARNQPITWFNTMWPRVRSGRVSRSVMASDSTSWLGEFDEQGGKMEDYYAEAFQPHEGSRRMWRRSGTTYYRPDRLRDGHYVGAEFVTWTKEGGRWVVREIAYASS